MKTYFDEETDKKLLEAKTEDEVRAILSTIPDGPKLAAKIDIVMGEIHKIKGDLDEEVDLDELDNTAGGEYKPDIVLSPTTSCANTEYIEDIIQGHTCGSNDHCRYGDEYYYRHTRYTNCKRGGKNDWGDSLYTMVYRCRKCGCEVDAGQVVKYFHWQD